MQTRKARGAGSTSPRKKTGLEALPAVSKLLASRPLQSPLRRYGTAFVTELLRDALAELRQGIRDGKLDPEQIRRATSASALASQVDQAARDLLAPRPRPVINATGVVVHTNLGRSILSAAAAEQVARVARGYVDLEYDVERGKRGSRLAHLAPLMRRLFPGHDFLVLNNNAAAIMLCLRCLAHGKKVLISRGELVEIGGSFRVPDILEASGAELKEVGTTNRTRLGDYEKAVSKKTGLILKVHTSNFRVVGFTEETTVGSLSLLAQRVRLPLVVDWGSGDLVDLAPIDIHDEMPALRVLEAGADLVTFSGDKLLGGPQAGFVVGRPDLIAKLRKDPLARVCRLDRLLIAALHQTLVSYVRGREFEEVPTLAMLATNADDIGRRAETMRREVARATRQGKLLSLVDGVSRTGGGSSPMGERPTRLLAVDWPTGDAGCLERRLRGGDPPVVGRVHDGRLLLDLRTVLPEQEATLTAAVVKAIADEIATFRQSPRGPSRKK